MQTGLEQLLDDPSPLQGRAFAWATSSGTASSGAASVGQLTAQTGQAPIWRGAPGRELGPREAVEVLVIDLTDGGLRSRPECGFLLSLLTWACEHRCPVLLLDRPNPLDGVTVEGPLVHPGFANPLGPMGVPLRHGMTPGELCAFFCRQNGLSVDLEVVGCQGWLRDEPSSTDPLHAGLHLLSATALRLSPGAPTRVCGTGIRSERLADLCTKGALDAALNSVAFRSAEPTDPTRGGVLIKVDHPLGVDPILLTLVLLEAAVREHSEARRGPFPWTMEPASTVPTCYTLDHLLGSPEARLGLESRVRSIELHTLWEGEAAKFRDERRPFLRY